MLEFPTLNYYELNNDIKILATAMDYYGIALARDSEEIDFTFYTNDNCLYLLAKKYLPKVERINDDKDKYNGIREVTLSNEEMSEYYSNLSSNVFNLYIGEYLIIKNEEGEIVDKACWTGEEMRPLRYDDFTSGTFGHLRPKKNDPYQACMFDSLSHNQINLITGKAGSGKAQPNSTLIPTLNGYKKLGDIKVGDKILDRFGKETTVLGVFPQGNIEKYKITFSDQRVSYCNDEHIWSCYTSKGNLKNFTVKEMLKMGIKIGNNYRFRIPISNPIEYSTKSFPIDPYVMGVFLGDGCCLETALTLSSEDIEIVEEVNKLINSVEYYSSTDKNYNYYFYKTLNSKHLKGQRCRILTKEFFKGFENEVLQYSYNKKIPEIYKYGSINQRFALLQGLMDTDGSIDSPEKGRTSFCSTSLQLIKDVQEICWSLGFSATISTDSRKEKYTNNICYKLLIQCNKNIKPNLFRLPRKKDIAIKYSKRNLKFQHHKNKLSIVAIEKCEEKEEMTCLYVDNPEHLYLTEQFIVTHNTLISLGYLFSLLDRKIDRIVIFCNPVAARNSAKLG